MLRMPCSGSAIARTSADRWGWPHAEWLHREMSTSPAYDVQLQWRPDVILVSVTPPHSIWRHWSASDNTGCMLISRAFPCHPAATVAILELSTELRQQKLIICRMIMTRKQYRVAVVHVTPVPTSLRASASMILRRRISPLPQSRKVRFNVKPLIT